MLTGQPQSFSVRLRFDRFIFAVAHLLAIGAIVPWITALMTEPALSFIDIAMLLLCLFLIVTDVVFHTGVRADPVSEVITLRRPLLPSRSIPLAQVERLRTGPLGVGLIRARGREYLLADSENTAYRHFALALQSLAPHVTIDLPSGDLPESQMMVYMENE